MTNYQHRLTINTYSIKMPVPASSNTMRDLGSTVRVLGQSSIHFTFLASSISRIYVSPTQSSIWSMPKVQAQVWTVSKAISTIHTPRLNQKSLTWHLKASVVMDKFSTIFSVLAGKNKCATSIARDTSLIGQHWTPLCHASVLQRMHYRVSMIMA